MPLVKAQCTSCGGVLEVDNSNDAAICPFCGMAYIVEKAINQYNAQGGSEYQKLLDAAHGFEKLEDYTKAYDMYLRITEEYPQCFDGWFGVWNISILSYISQGQLISPEMLNNYGYAMKTASENQKKLLNRKIQEYKRYVVTQTPVERARAYERQMARRNIVDETTVVNYVSEAVGYHLWMGDHLIKGLLCRGYDDGSYSTRIWDPEEYKEFRKNNGRAAKYNTTKEKDIFNVPENLNEKILISSISTMLREQGFGSIVVSIKYVNSHKAIIGKYSFWLKEQKYESERRKAIFISCTW